MIPYLRPKVSDFYTLSQTKLLRRKDFHTASYINYTCITVILTLFQKRIELESQNACIINVRGCVEILPLRNYTLLSSAINHLPPPPPCVVCVCVCVCVRVGEAFHLPGHSTFRDKLFPQRSMCYTKSSTV